MNTEHPTYPRPPRSNGGFVLVCVLWVLAILTVVGVGFQRSAQRDAEAAIYAMDYAKAVLMARGAVHRGIVEVSNMRVINFYDRKENGVGLGQAWAHPKDMFEENIYQSLGNGEEYAEDSCRYIIEDEAGRISINSCNEALLENVEGLRPSQRRKIMRRRTHATRENERAQRIQTLEELRYMFDKITDEEWYGDGETLGLTDMITCHGSAKININTAIPAVLQCVPDLSSNVVDAIVSYRAGGDQQIGTKDDKSFRTLDDVATKLGIEGRTFDALRRYCTTTSTCFTIVGTATLQQGKVRAYCKAVMRGMEVLQWREEPVGS